MIFSNTRTLNALATGMLAGVFLIATPASAQIYGGNDGKVLLGAGIGAGLGGIFGSNLAGTGVQQEGTAIGAVLGGIAGAAIANQYTNRQYTNRQYTNRNTSQNPHLRSSRYGGFMPGYGPGYGYEYNRRASVPYSTFGGRYVNTNANMNTNVGTNYSDPYIPPSFVQAPYIQAPFIQPIYWPNMQTATQYIQGPNLVQVYTIPHVTQPMYSRPVQYSRPAPTHAFCYGAAKRSICR